MKHYLMDKGVPKSNIFLDHAGFDTYNSLLRAKKIFQVNNLIIVTQKFHLKRSLFIANHIGLTANGFLADRHQYYIAKQMYFREKLANVKALLELLIHRNPTYLGNKIPITGDSKKSFD
jgi:SanA protein